MTIRQLRIFQAVCDQGTVTGAADKLFMTQPAVSHVISDLEKELEYPLFDRIAHKIHLNGAGRMLLQKARGMLALYDELVRDSKNLEKRAPILIGSSITIANFWLPAIINRFREVFDAVPLKITVESAGNITEKLLLHELDLALIEGAVQNDQLVRIPFSSYRLIGICAPKHPFGVRDSVAPEVFVQEHLLLREIGSAIRDTLDSALRLFNFTAEPMLTSVNSQALIQSVKAGVGVSVLPEILVQNELNSGSIAAFHLDGIELENKNYLIYHKEKYQSETFQFLVNAIKGMQGGNNNPI